MSSLIRIAGVIALAPTALAVLALFAMMVMTFFDVVLRSTINTPIEAATELTRIMMAVVVFATLPVISARNDHIAVDLMDGYFKPAAARLRDAAIALICGAMLWWPAERVVVLAKRAESYGDVTEYLAIPQHYIAWFVAVFTYLTMAALIVRGLILIVEPRALEAAAPDGPAPEGRDD